MSRPLTPFVSTDPRFAPAPTPQPQEEPICPECGEPGRHWIESPGFTVSGFWTCDKFYGPDGRRLNP